MSARPQELGLVLADAGPRRRCALALLTALTAPAVRRPVVILDGYIDGEDGVTAASLRAAGAGSYLREPFSLEELLGSIEEACKEEGDRLHQA